MKKKFYLGALFSMIAALGAPAIALAATQPVVVTPSSLQGWQEYPGSGQLSFVNDTTSPLPTGALQFDTPANPDEVQMYRDLTPTAIKKINSMSYSAKRLAGPAYASPSYTLGIDTNNDNTDDFYAWYEPVYNQPANTNYDQWQTFTLDKTTTKFWSFSAIDSSGHGGANGANFFTLTDVQNDFPKAKVIDLTLNVGSGTPGWSVRADNVTFDNTTWNFELKNVPTDKSQCKNGGYANYTDNDGTVFKNQGDCVSYVTSKNGSNTTTNNNNVTITS
ncbi:MAG: hypothetical protein JWM81_1190, partial [Candidatus Saccharibacteria bacterium]|nr:hypothetical protein [Candidatus Saccharibacteria bacterium]